jgi:hypothetical protein
MKAVDIDETGEAKVLEPEEDPNLKPLLIEPGDQAPQIREKLFDMFNLSVHDANNAPMASRVNIRLRKRNGHLVPINEDLKPNSKLGPYVLECFVAQIRRRPSQALHDHTLKNNSDTKRQIDERLTTALATRTMLNKYSIRVAQMQTTLNLSAYKYFNEIINAVSLFVYKIWNKKCKKGS